MHFGNPEYFPFLFLAPVFALFLFWVERRKKSALHRFIPGKLVSSLTDSSKNSHYLIKRILFCLFVLLISTALLRPQFGIRSEIVERKGIDIMIALDVSKSMLAEDHRPNRLERAKHELEKLIDMLRGNRIGLAIFAGESFVQCPLTLDHAALKSFLRPVSTDWVNIQGTAIAEAINKSREALHSENRTHRVLILFSDGEDHEGNVEEAARAAASEGIVIYTIGIGSENGVPIPLKTESGDIRYKTDRQGNVVMTRLDPATLQNIARLTGGKFYYAQYDFELSDLYDEISKFKKQEFGMTETSSYADQYQLFLIIGLVFLFTQFFISERTKRESVWKGRFEQ
ncbi:aerotolerance regulator BatB [Chitinispirillum alkaliphilum]|nr:aerotolerance regulator BatB [Chitinispirillum alkaliphilum]